MSDDTRDAMGSMGSAGDAGEDLDDTWRVVRTVGTEEEAMMAIGFLRTNGIPAEVESLHVHELPVDLGEMSEVRIRVPAEKAEEALALLESQDQAAPILDEAESMEAATRDGSDTQGTE